jgi:hypothetical protein
MVTDGGPGRRSGTDLLRSSWRGDRARPSAAAVLRAAYLDDTFFKLPLHRQVVEEASYRRDLAKEAQRAVQRYGQLVAAEVGMTAAEQRRDLTRIARRYLVRPKDYYRYRLFQDDRRDLAPDILSRRLTKYWMFNYLHDRLSVTERAPLTDKLDFASHCQRYELAHIPIAGTLVDGAVSDGFRLPDADVFFKPIDRKGGFGASAWELQPDGTYSEVGTERTASSKKLVKRYLKRSLKNPYLVSPRLVNHPDLNGLALDALCTVRIVAAINEEGNSEALAAVFRMPAVAGKAVDNGHAGGIAARVDLATGELDVAASLDAMRTSQHVTHPVTAAPIAGVTMPSWEEVASLARQAQQAFTPRLVAAWDIAITPTGPVLVEGNSRPGLDLIQQTHGPLGRLRIGALLAHHVRSEWEHRQGAGGRVSRMPAAVT